MKCSSASLLVLSIAVSACSIETGYAQTASAASPTVINSGGFIVVVSLQFSPKGDELARTCAFGPVALFDTAKRGKARTFLAELQQTPALVSLAYNPDGALIATARGTDGALIWDAHNPGKPANSRTRDFLHVNELYALVTPLRVLEAPSAGDDLAGRVDWIGFSPDGRVVLTAHGDGRLSFWDTRSWKKVEEFVAAPGPLTAVAFAPDSRTIAVADQKGTLHEWNVERKAEIRTLTAVPPLSRLEFSPNGRMLVGSPGAGQTESVIIWETSKWESRRFEGYSCATLSHRGELLALGGRGHVELIQAVSRRDIARIDLPETTNGVLFADPKRADANEKVAGVASALTFSPDDRTLAVGELSGNVDLFDVSPFRQAP